MLLGPRRGPLLTTARRCVVRPCAFACTLGGRWLHSVSCGLGWTMRARCRYPGRSAESERERAALIDGTWPHSLAKNRTPERDRARCGDSVGQKKPNESDIAKRPVATADVTCVCATIVVACGGKVRGRLGSITPSFAAGVGQQLLLGRPNDSRRCGNAPGQAPADLCDGDGDEFTRHRGHAQRV